MDPRACGFDWAKISDWEDRDDLTATLTIRTKDGRDIGLCVCPSCLRQLAGYLAGAASGLEFKYDERRSDGRG